jgi:transcriptional regulator with XRE-family HTH domain
MNRRRLLPSQLAEDLGVSHAAVSRWLSGKDVPNMQSCLKLAELSGTPIHRILAITARLPQTARVNSDDLPEFREYASNKYPDVLDEDLIVMIEDLIDRRRQKRL